MLNRILTVIIGSVAFFPLLLATTACAHYRGSSYSITLETETGDPLPSYYHRGKTYILGYFGDRYNIRVYNHSSRRIEAVISVDGRDVISGDVADYTRHRGYVIQPYDSVLVRGFRQSMSQVAAFRFTDSHSSYSSRRGTPQNVGVVGVAIFKEKTWTVHPRPLAIPERRLPSSRKETKKKYRGRAEGYSSRSPSSAAPSKESIAGSEAEDTVSAHRRYRMEPRNNLGTEYGESRYDRARQVRFRRKNSKYPSEIFSLFYDDRQGLLARGIAVYSPTYPPSAYTSPPRAFPRNRFAPPPP